MTCPALLRPLLMLAALTVAGPGCGPQGPAKPRDRQAELTALRQDLFSHTFKGASATALERTITIARESKGTLAADAWAQAGLARFDWALLGLFGGPGGLLDRLLRHLDLPASCLVDGEIATSCLASVVEGVAGPFRRAGRLYGEHGDPSQADLALRRARLAEAAILHRVVESPVYFDTIREGLRDKAYDLVRGSQILLAASWLARVPDLRSAGPLAAPTLLLQAAPYPCPRAFLAWGKAPRAELARALEGCRCAYPCPEPPPTVVPAGAPPPAVPACSAPPLLQVDQPYLTPLTYHAAQALKVLADHSGSIRENRLQGLQLRLSAQIRRFRASVAELRVRVPYPARILMGTEPVVAPSWRGPAPVAWELTAAVHVVATASGTAVGLAPVLGVLGDEVALLCAQAGLRLPGGAVSNRTRFMVQTALQQAREVVRTKLGLDGKPGVVALYLDRTATLGSVASWLTLLHEAGERTVELVIAVEGVAAYAVEVSWRASAPAGDQVRSVAKLDPATPLGAWLAAELARPDAPLAQRLAFVLTP